MKTTPFYNLELQAGAKMAEGAWATVFSYTDPKTEHMSVRENVGLIDFSTMGNIDIKGKDCIPVMQKLIVNDMNKLVPGMAIYTTIVDKQGGIIDDLTIYQFGTNHYMIVTSTSNRFKVHNILKDLSTSYDLYVTDITSGVGIMCLQGPKSVDLINEISDTKIDDIKYFHFKCVHIGDAQVLVSRTGFTGSRGYELYIGAEDCNSVWTDVMNVGDKYGLQLCGGQVGANTLPLEKGYLTRELSEGVNPYEVGLGWTVKLDKDIKCVAYDALSEIKKKGPSKKLIGFIMPDITMTVQNGSPVYSDGKKIGVVTSAGIGYTLNKFIGMASIEAEYADLGTQIQVVSENKPVNVVVCDKVFWDPERKYL